MKENYTELEIEIVDFENADVITASGEYVPGDDFWG